MHYLYILKSEKTGKYYVGESSDVEKRLENIYPAEQVMVKETVE